MADTNDYEKIVRAKLGSREDVRDYDFMQFSVGVIRGLLGMLSDCRAQIAASERRANEMRQAFIDALNNSQAATPADAALADALETASNRCHGQDVAALRKAAAALRARPQAVPEAVAKDAARYRWLRRKVCIIQRSGFMGTVADRYADFEFINVPMPTYMAPDAAVELDASIDREITEEKYNELAAD